MKQTSIILPFYSGAGHTRQLAQAIAEGAAEAGAMVRLVDVEAITAPDWQALDAAQAILFGTPTYMGSVAARYGQFIEEAAGRWLDYGWCDKIAGGFTVGTSPAGDKLAALQRLSVFAAQMGMIWVGPSDIGAPAIPEAKGLNADGCWLGLAARSVQEPRGSVRPGDLETARRFGARVARIAGRLGPQGSDQKDPERA